MTVFALFLMLLLLGVFFLLGSINEFGNHKPRCQECDEWKASIKAHEQTIAANKAEIRRLRFPSTVK